MQSGFRHAPRVEMRQLTARAVATAILVVLVAPAWAGPLPRRVVSVNITSDEVLLALVPERLVGVSVLATDPAVSNVVREAAAVPVRVKADAERILALEPDLVVIGAHSADVARQLEEVGVRVITIQGFESIQWIEALIRTLGDATGARPRAEQMIAEMRARLVAVRARVMTRPRPRVLTYSAWGVTTGRGTILNDVIRAAGSENVAAALGILGWKRLPLEQLLVSDPDAVVLSATRRWAPGFHAEFLTHPALRTVRAFRDGRVYQLPGRLMTTSSHHIAETVEALANLLHPGALQQGSR